MYNQVMLGLGSEITLTMLIAAVMFFPSLGVIITRIITKEGFKQANIKPQQLRKTFQYYLLGWFGPMLLIAFGAAVYYLIYPGDFDPSMSVMLEQLRTQLAAVGAEQLSPDAARGMFITQLAIGVLAAPILNFVTCFGEEWGWRGYLLPKVNEHLAFIPTILVTGVIWGLWHAPLTAIGHNYGLDYPGFPWLGILTMCGFCTAAGTFLSYLTIKSKSCIPAALAHGSINGFAAVGLYFSASMGNPFIGPSAVGVLGGSGLIIAAVVICLRLRIEPLWPSANTQDNHVQKPPPSTC